MDWAEIKRIAIVGLFGDSSLCQTLVLKGGNLLDIVYGIAGRSSIDLDFSMEGDIAPDEFAVLEQSMTRALEAAYAAEGLMVLDAKLTAQPKTLSEEMRSFWGGYTFEFKLISVETYHHRYSEGKSVQKAALVIGPGNLRTMRIDLSRFEYCSPKKPRELSGQVIYVYTPLMLLCEKLRAICQQMPEYRKMVRSSLRTGRARDFFDIHAILTGFRIDLGSQEYPEMVRAMFAAKHVPLRLISELATQREFHRADFQSIRDTVKPTADLKDFDFYFDYVIERCCRPLEALWNI